MHLPRASPAQLTRSLLALLDEVLHTVEHTPPVDNAKSRFGNPAFRDFYDKVHSVSRRTPPSVATSAFSQLGHSSRSSLDASCQHAAEWHRTIPGLDEQRIPELSVYFGECWGNRTRVDYGSGMELNFLCWLSVPTPLRRRHSSHLSAARCS